MMSVQLRTVPLPDFTVPDLIPVLATDEYEHRVGELYDRSGVDWVIVYADREHTANMAFLTGFDPRFEEALLVLGSGNRRFLLVGNEGLIYAPVARLVTEVVLCQTFSLMGQRRTDAPRLADALAGVGMKPGHRVGVAGWKYLQPEESTEWKKPSFVPAFVVRTVESVTNTATIDATAALMHPESGLRANNSATQIACFEWAAARSSAAVLRVTRAAKPGTTELEAVGAMGYAGEPLSAHVMFASGKDTIIGLRSPTAKVIKAGDGASTAIGYWGGLSCRAGIVDYAKDDRFLEQVVYPYYGAIATWYGSLRLGVDGASIDDSISKAFANVNFGSMLNPGHLISIEEWMHTPIRPGSTDRIRSGMAFQCDIIPSPLHPGWAVNCEDSVVVADRALREEIAAEHPDVWQRIELRQAFMREQLGLDFGDEVLPLSSTPGYLAPFWLAEEEVCTVAS